MKTSKEKAADAIIELHSSIMDIDDFNEFPFVLETVIKKIFHVDWLGLWTFHEGSKAYNISTNPSLPFDWDEKYIEIYDHDKIRKHALTLSVGGTFVYDPFKDNHSDEEIYMFEYIKKHTDTSFFAGIRTAKEENTDSAIGMYRADVNYPFTPNDKKVLDYLSPVLVSITHMMNLCSTLDIKRATVDELESAQKALSITLNNKLVPVRIPKETARFFNKHFHNADKNPIPRPIVDWVENTIAPEGRLKPNTGPWCLKLPLFEMDLHCKAQVVVTALKQLALLIILVPHGRSIDFSILNSAGLSAREIESVSYLPLGYSNRQIATAMAIEEVTAKKHLKNAAHKLEASGKTELLYRAIKTKEMLESFL